MLGFKSIGIGCSTYTLNKGVGGWKPFAGAAVDIDFATGHAFGGTLATLLTTARATPSLTYAETKAGKLVAFAANLPRITDRGVLVESARTNFARQSQAFDNAVWSPSNASVAANALTAPDDTATMDKIVPNTNSTQHFITMAATLPLSANTYAISIYVDAGQIPKFGMRESAINGAYATWDCRGDGEVRSIGSPATAATIEKMFGTIYRCTMIVPCNSNSFNFQLFSLDVGYVSGSPLSYQWAGDGAIGTGLWGFQIEVGNHSTSYIPVTVADVSRAADVNKVVGAGLSAVQGSAVTLFAITQPLGFVPVGGSRIVGTNSPVPLNTGSNTQVQNYNGSGSATATIPYSAKFQTDEIWAMTKWTSSLTKSIGNGGPIATDAHGISGITDVYLGSTNGGFTLDGYISRLAIWTSALSDALLTSLTAPGAHFSAAAVEVWGDSLTSGNQDGSGVTWPNALAGLLGGAVYNFGVGGETSTQIKARFDAFSAGYASPQIFMAGRNDFQTPTTVKSNIAAMVAALSTTMYLVGSILPSATDSGANLITIGTLNSDLSTTYGSRFIDLLSALQAANNGGANDLADVAAGIIPRSLRASGDPLHLNAAGYMVVANAYNAKRATLGF